MAAFLCGVSYDLNIKYLLDCFGKSSTLWSTCLLYFFFSFWEPREIDESYMWVQGEQENEGLLDQFVLAYISLA